MATATEIATKALRRLGVIDALESPSAADEKHATEALSALIASWETLQMAGDALPINARFERGLTAMLAVHLSDDYGKAPSAILLDEAKRGETALLAAFLAVRPSTFDSALQVGRYGYRQLDTTYAKDLAVWSPDTQYELYTRAYWGGQIYEVTTAGTSGSTGPSGTGSDITDGTVIWVWRRAAVAPNSTSFEAATS